MANITMDETLLKDAITIIQNSKTDVFALGEVTSVLTILQNVLKEQGTKTEEVKTVVPEVVEETVQS